MLTENRQGNKNHKNNNKQNSRNRNRNQHAVTDQDNYIKQTQTNDNVIILNPSPSPNRINTNCMLNTDSSDLTATTTITSSSVNIPSSECFVNSPLPLLCDEPSVTHQQVIKSTYTETTSTTKPTSVWTERSIVPYLFAASSLDSSAPALTSTPVTMSTQIEKASRTKTTSVWSERSTVPYLFAASIASLATATTSTTNTITTNTTESVSESENKTISDEYPEAKREDIVSGAIIHVEFVDRSSRKFMVGQIRRNGDYVHAHCYYVHEKSENKLRPQKNMTNMKMENDEYGLYLCRVHQFEFPANDQIMKWYIVGHVDEDSFDRFKQDLRNLFKEAKKQYRKPMVGYIPFSAQFEVMSDGSIRDSQIKNARPVLVVASDGVYDIVIDLTTTAKHNSIRPHLVPNTDECQLEKCISTAHVRYNNNNNRNFLDERTVLNLLSWNGYLASGNTPNSLQWNENNRYIEKTSFRTIMKFMIQYTDNMEYQSNHTEIPVF
jgi:hypothetical protein